MTINQKDIARVTVVETIYFQAMGSQPLSLEKRYNFQVPNEQPFIRHKGISSKIYERVENGWVKGVCVVHIENEGTELLYLSFDGIGDHIPLFPQRTIRLEVVDIGKVYIRSNDNGKDGKYCISLLQQSPIPVPPKLEEVNP